MKKEYTEKDFEEYLNDIYGDIDVLGVKYPAGYVLKEVDPIRFNVAFSDWLAEKETEDEEEAEEEVV